MLTPTLSPGALQRTFAATTIVGRFGTWENASAFDVLAGSHPDISAPSANRCFTQLGLAYGTMGGAWTLGLSMAATETGMVTWLDDKNPGLVLFDATSSGEPRDLVGWGYGGLYNDTQPKFLGTDWGADETWFGHFGGWHLAGNGGMAVWTPDIEQALGSPGDPSDSSPEGPWTFPPFQPPPCADGTLSCWGPGPFIWHPALWDLRVWLDNDGSYPRVQDLASPGQDPCKDITTPSVVGLQLTAGNVAMSTFNGGMPFTTFFRIGEFGAPLPFP